MTCLTVILASWCAVVSGAPEQVVFESSFIFDPEKESHGHVHASCVVECPNGDLRAVWYENGRELPPPYFSKEKDKSDDVRIGGSRKPNGVAAWEPTYVAADTFGVSDNNPCMVIDRDAKLWLFHAVLLGVPEKTWTSALIRYHISTTYERPGPPKWDVENLLIVHPVGYEKALAGMRERGNLSEEQRQAGMSETQGGLKDPYKTRLGWMPRAHPIIRSDGALLIPLANENSGVAAMAITTDGGATWTIGQAVPGRGLEQPTVVEFPDKSMAAFFRNGRPAHRILRSDSQDGGMTWSPVTMTDLPHPGAGIEAILLRDGRMLMIYNDSEKERDRLAVSVSEDRGASWTHTRHLENSPGQRFDYPSILQGKDGTFHATYSYNTKAIKYVHFNEQWLAQAE
jgi:predicted neuraminidase